MNDAANVYMCGVWHGFLKASGAFSLNGGR